MSSYFNASYIQTQVSQRRNHDLNQKKIPNNAGLSPDNVPRAPSLIKHAILLPHHDLFSGMLTQARPLKTTAATKAVKIPAPARSAVVMGLTEPGVVESPTPAVGSPLLVPPVFDVKGALACWIRLLWMTSIAAICCPTPDVPSHVAPCAQLSPHILPFGWSAGDPLHWSAAALAEVSRTALTRS